MYFNTFFTPAIYDPLVYFILCCHCISLQWHLLPHHSTTLYGILFMQLHNCISKPFLTLKIHDHLRYSCLCYCSIVLQWLFYHTNLWPFSLLIFMLLHHCYPANIFPYMILLFMQLYHCMAIKFVTQTNLWPSKVLLML